MQDAVTVHIDAPPEAVWDLVSDVTKIGRYSPETFEAEWLDGATGPGRGPLPGPREAQPEGPDLLGDLRDHVCEPNRVLEFTSGRRSTRA